MRSASETQEEPRARTVEPPWAQQILADVALVRSRLTLIYGEVQEMDRRYAEWTAAPILEELSEIRRLLRKAATVASFSDPAAFRLRNWWHGGRIERARRLVQEADIRLVRIVMDDASEAANVAHAIRHALRLEPDDPMRLRLERHTGPLYPERMSPVSEQVAARAAASARRSARRSARTRNSDD